MKKTAIFFGSTTGNTEGVAKTIAEKLNAETFDVSTIRASKIEEFDFIIMGTSTWGIGDLQDDWEIFLEDLESIDFTNKTIALFGLGDSISYADTFVDGIGTIYNSVKNRNGKIIGEIETDGYDFEDSTAIINGKFIGLPIDEDNESHKTNTRIEKWVEQLKNQLQ